MALVQPPRLEGKVDGEEQKDADDDQEEPEGGSGRFHTCIWLSTCKESSSQCFRCKVKSKEEHDGEQLVEPEKHVAEVGVSYDSVVFERRESNERDQRVERRNPSLKRIRETSEQADDEDGEDDNECSNWQDMLKGGQCDEHDDASR